MKRLRVAVSCALLAALVGCSNGQVKPENYSGFIGDYSTLAPATAPSGAPLLRWVDPQADVRRYQRIYIEPSRFYPVPKPNDKVSAKTLADITTYYDQALRRELGKSLPLASAPGPGILVLKPAITAVSSHTQGLRPYEVIPIALIAAGMSTAVGIRDQDTQIATEAMLLDGGDNKVLAKMVRQGTGKALDDSDQPITGDDVKALARITCAETRSEERPLTLTRICTLPPPPELSTLLPMMPLLVLCPVKVATVSLLTCTFTVWVPAELAKAVTPNWVLAGRVNTPCVAMMYLH